MKDWHKISLIYIFLFIPTMIIGGLFEELYIFVNDGALIVILINTVLLIVLANIFKVRYSVVTKFLIIVLALFTILIIDKDIFYSSYIQSTTNPLKFSYFTYITNILLIPFALIFDALYTFNLFEASFIIIPTYLVTLIFINKALAEHLVKRNIKIKNNSI